MAILNATAKDVIQAAYTYAGIAGESQTISGARMDQGLALLNEFIIGANLEEFIPYSNTVKDLPGENNDLYIFSSVPDKWEPNPESYQEGFNFFRVLDMTEAPNADSIRLYETHAVCVVQDSKGVPQVIYQIAAFEVPGHHGEPETHYRWDNPITDVKAWDGWQQPIEFQPPQEVLDLSHNGNFTRIYTTAPLLVKNCLYKTGLRYTDMIKTSLPDIQKYSIAVSAIPCAYVYERGYDFGYLKLNRPTQYPLRIVYSRDLMILNLDDPVEVPAEYLQLYKIGLAYKLAVRYMLPVDSIGALKVQLDSIEHRIKNVNKDNSMITYSSLCYGDIGYGTEILSPRNR